MVQLKVKSKKDETCYAKMLSKETGKINWNNSAESIHNLIRGLNPRPIAHTTYKDENMKIYESEVLAESSNKEAGTILECKQKRYESFLWKRYIIS